MDDKTSSGMTIFNKKKAKNTNQGRERRRGLPKVVASNAEEKAEAATEEKTEVVTEDKAEAVTEEATVSQKKKTADNSDTEKTLEETPKTTTDEPTSVDSATDEVLETTNAEVSADETSAETGTEPEPQPVSDTPKPTTTSKDNRKQIKLSPYLMEKIDQIKRIKKMSYNYEVLDELVDDYVENQLTEEERAFFNMNMKFFKKDLE